MNRRVPEEIGRGSRARVLGFLLDNLGRVVTSNQIRRAAEASEWARRLRELRDEFGYQILSFRDRRDIRPNQYLLETDIRLPLLPRFISKETRAFVLERNGYTCQMCGIAAADPDPYHRGQKVRLVLGHIIDKLKEGADTPGNLRALCSNCNEGLQAAAPPKPKRIELLKQVRRATVDDQLYLLDWLQAKFAKAESSEDH
ncbi:MAG: HNH endonuclease [Terriglobia bacterium]